MRRVRAAGGFPPQVMGLLDRFLPKSTPRLPAIAHPVPTAPVAAPEIAPVAAAPQEVPVATPPAAPISPTPVSEPVPASPAAPVTGGGAVLARLKAAREALELKDRAGAMAIYEEVLATAGDRADALRRGQPRGVPALPRG